MVSKEI
jgi:hypothetical protein